MSHPTSLLVILDLDETLFHSRTEPLGRPSDFRIDEYHTYKRPGVDEFLRQLAIDPRFELAVWTSAAEDYAATGVMNLGIQKDSLRALFSHDRCVRTSLMPEMGIGGGQRLVKDLRKLERLTGWPVERMIAIDDDGDYYVRQYSNLLLVDPYYGTVERQQGLFPALLDELAHLYTLPNVRPVEKRRWYEKYLKRKV
jgi:TFIIF-interacting CTD phosphatase-like protein